MTDETTTPPAAEEPDTQPPGHAVDEPGADTAPQEEVAEERTEAAAETASRPPQAGEVDTGQQAGQVGPAHEQEAGQDIYGTESEG